MDEYTQKTKIWLDNRFRQTSNDGVYYAHQPIYGFRKGHSDPSTLGKYSMTYQIIKALSHIEFESFLDVGGAEGYKTSIVQKIFDVKVTNCDLSEEACKRAMEIYNIKSDCVDIQKLPYQDGEFDVVLCSETIEHVSNTEKAIDELLRVSKKAVIITVPYEKSEKVEENIRRNISHAHIHNFNLRSFEYLKPMGYEVFSKKVSSLLLRMASLLIIAQYKQCHTEKGLSKYLVDIYNACIPFLKTVLGRRVASIFIRLDDVICRLPFLPYYSILFVISKNRRYHSRKETKNISPSQILTFSVPYHYLQNRINKEL